MSLSVVVTSILVDNQENALTFYTEKPGFLKKQTYALESTGGLPLYPQKAQMG